ncbi:MAG TPA: DJ-1/PfpI family protein [Prolixibacteraceae bacterium]|nr:DJ-1/PfpI family protein [Prolixibacteraceae bacterium]HPS13663.1 DJ-1/PfpI family protein [Prolixibacteraceae bacterium]
MKKVLLLLAEGFETFEASVFIDVIGWNLTDGDGSTRLFSCGLKKSIKTSFDQTFVVDYLVDEIDVDDFDALAIPGGFEEYDFYADAYDERFLNLIRQFYAKGKIIASICVAALVLGKSGVLKDRNATTYNTRQELLVGFGVHVVNEPIVVDGNIITSWNPSTAAFVAFTLLGMLTSKENENYIREIMGFEKIS